MAGGRSGANSGGESEEWGEEVDETTPAPTQSPLKKRKGQFSTLLHRIYPKRDIHTFSVIKSRSYFQYYMPKTE
jgi:hypothetical protein